MRVLVLNGSPKGENSNTIKITTAFLEGMADSVSLETEILPVNKMNITPCLGCFNCWHKTPGECCIDDDMRTVIEKMLTSDIIIWSFPLYYFGLPSQMKALMDRQLPTILPFMSKNTDNNSDYGSHPTRYDMLGKRYILISTCGFYTADGNYTAVNQQFDRYLGEGNYETIFCGEGELFRVPELHKRTDKYLEYVKVAGAEFAFSGISAKSKENLSELLYPREVFENMADASWGIANEEKDCSDTDSVAYILFTKQMAALYNSATWNGKDKILEMHYTDVEKTYQIILHKNGSKVLSTDFLPFTTKIHTPFSVWADIAKGKIDGQKALMERLYRVEGDFDFMLKWDDYFGQHKQEKSVLNNIDTLPKSNLTLLILPWLTIWVAMSISPFVGGVLGIIGCAMLSFAFLKWKPTTFECISLLVVSCISLLAVLNYPKTSLIPISYLIFGMMWLITAFLKIPLTAYYSMNSYGGAKAFDNPLFIKTNRILTACWGVLYLATSVWTFYLMGSSFSSSISIINNLLPILLGIFTVWFQKWYPAYYARK